ncbi:MAG: ParB/RepB/Spo0J family partition protein, partial [Sporichthyaceae bacterium]|nr:ParB/RepB/Spo0J family partition protein [Sporichthyaceae bacterium]
MSTLLDLDPRTLAAHPSNIRTDLGDLEELSGSLAAAGGIGLIQPVVVAPVDGGYLIVAGHRRAMAAVQAGLQTVPCVVREDLAGLAPEQIAAMLADTTHKPLTASEESSGYAQLAAFDGWTPQRIAKATGRRTEHVQRALILHRLPAQARAAADRGALTLDDAERLDQFSDDQKALDRILTKSGAWGIRHAIDEEIRKRDAKARQQATRAELTEAGVKIIKRPKEFRWGSREAAATDLVDQAGNRLVDDEVRTKPGFAAVVETSYSGDPLVTIVCEDPEAWGYRRLRGTNYVPPAEAARREEEKQANQVWRAEMNDARHIRHAFLAETFGTAKSAKTARLDALRDILAEPNLLTEPDDTHADLYRHVVGADPDTIDIAAAGEARLSRLLIARWVIAHEQNLADCEPDHHWRAKPELACAWLDRLVAAGYELSQAEGTLCARLTPTDDDTEENE